jgi:16S rRNA (cytidine1402-2'-O)-methyltransferase
VLARELTKKFETIRPGTLAELQRVVTHEPQEQLGEFVILIHGAAEVAAGGDPEVDRVLRVLLDAVPLKEAVTLAARLTGASKNELYDRALALKTDATAKTPS